MATRQPHFQITPRRTYTHPPDTPAPEKPRQKVHRNNYSVCSYNGCLQLCHVSWLLVVNTEMWLFPRRYTIIYLKVRVTTWWRAHARTHIHTQYESNMRLENRRHNERRSDNHSNTYCNLWQSECCKAIWELADKAEIISMCSLVRTGTF